MIGALLLAAAAFNMYLLPYPIWFEIGNLLVFPLCTFCAMKLGSGRAWNLRKEDVDSTHTDPKR